MIIERVLENPILKPNKNNPWEAQAVFNGCPIKVNDKIYLLFRALSYPHYHSFSQQVLSLSEIGIAKSNDGIHFNERERFIYPEFSWERFGCEDPRVTKLDNEYFIFYTALSCYPFRPEGIKIGLAISSDLKKIKEKHLITPFNAKAMALFPEKINGKIYGILTVHTDIPPAEICLVSFDKKEDIYSQSFWLNWYQNYKKYSLPLRRKKEDHIEVGSPPLKTDFGWLVFYSYIRNYFSHNPLFGIEAFLLDLKNPQKIIAQTEYPLLIPEEYYEVSGMVPSVVFPSGALKKQNEIYLYYGAADTTCCLAKINSQSFFDFLLKKNKISLTREKINPIISPVNDNFWENKAVFNPAVVYLKNNYHFIYRALGENNVSCLGYARSSDGIHINYRYPKPVYTPKEEFELKKNESVYSYGCEDPRLTIIDDKIYMLYTAFDGITARVAITSIKIDDFLNEDWRWTKAKVISPPNFFDKDAFLFPEKVNGSFLIIHRLHNNINFSLVSDLDFKNNEFLEEEIWIKPRKGWWDSKKIGAAAPPLKTEKGWFMLYHGISDDNIYRVGYLLLDLKNPLKILKRSDYPILEPEEEYEKKGIVENVVFPTGNVLKDGIISVYYGAADKVICLATIKLEKLLAIL